MCEFFSFNSINGRFFYFKPEDIAKIRNEGNPNNFNFNSHASIADFYGFVEDKSNKYEYNPFSGEFEIDQINGKDDSKCAEKWVRKLWSIPHKEFIGTARIYFDQPDFKKLEVDLKNIPEKNKKKVIKFVKMITHIDWFRPQIRPDKNILQKQVDKTLKAFKYEATVKVNILPLRSPSDWDAARVAAGDAARVAARVAVWDAARVAAGGAAWDAAGDAAGDAARDAAWDAAHIVVEDLMKAKGYSVNPFDCLMWFWKKGLYPIGVINGKFEVYYVPLRSVKYE